jgi:hypothetical protein
LLDDVPDLEPFAQAGAHRGGEALLAGGRLALLQDVELDRLADETRHGFEAGRGVAVRRFLPREDVSTAAVEHLDALVHAPVRARFPAGRADIDAGVVIADRPAHID